MSEKILVEEYIIQRLIEMGWKHVAANELERENYEEPLLIPNLIRAIQRINKSLEISDEEIYKVINELKLISGSIEASEGSKKILNYYKFGIPIKFDKERVLKYVQLFDYGNIDNNEYILSNQVYYYGRDRIRIDIILYINGVPLVNIECKDPAQFGSSWTEAYRQIESYVQVVPEIYKYVQIGVAVEQKAKYFPIIQWPHPSIVYEWHEMNKDSIDSFIEILSKEKLLDIIRNFLFNRIQSGKATKVITRYMQYAAANKIVQRVSNNLQGLEQKNNGLIWHWQGSGKTLTMIFAAHKLYYSSLLENPSIFFIVDRIELKDQIYEEFNYLDILKPEVINSVYELQDILRHDDYKGKRGIFITLIHKFRPEELKSLYANIANISKEKQTIMTRKNVIAFIDEAHRTQYGALAAQMRDIFQNAFFFAFTGTPLSKIGRDTYCLFSYLPEEKYLDKYFIVDSIKDGFTVKIIYKAELESMHLDKIDKELLQEFFKQDILEEIPEEARNEAEKKIKDKLDKIKVILENTEYIRSKSEFIAKHFKENIDGKFKAMVVAASRKACRYYKEELDKLLPKEYSEIVITPEIEDIRTGFVKETRERYGGDDFSDIAKKIINNFRKEDEFPRILIVTDMLLAGFDAPILKVMYLDKVIKEHRLLQAIARTNRPYGEFKEAGIIIDFVGIFKYLEQAFKLYSKEEIKLAISDYESLKINFEDHIKELQEIFRGLPFIEDRKVFIKAIEILTTDAAKEAEFTEKYKKIRNIFEILGPDQIKIKYYTIYKWLSELYAQFMKQAKLEAVISIDEQKYLEKTLKYVYSSTKVDELTESLPAVSIDEDFLIKLEQKAKSIEEKAGDVVFPLQKIGRVDRYKSPANESIADRVDNLMKMWREKIKDYKQIYAEGTNIIHEYNSISQRQKNLDFSNLEYSMLLALEQQLGKKASQVEQTKEFIAELNSNLSPGWLSQTTVKKAVEREVRKFSRSFKIKNNLSIEKLDVLYNKLIECVMNYGH